MKQCNSCGVEKDNNLFYKDKRRKKNGLRYECIACSKKSAKEYNSRPEVKIHTQIKDREYLNRPGVRKLAYARNRKYCKTIRKFSLNRTTIARREYEIQRKYNLTLDQYKQLLESQNNSCSICKKPFKETSKICVDHDHNCCNKSGYSCGKCVRGLLCFRCNCALGSFNDDTEILKRAIRYLNKETK